METAKRKKQARLLRNFRKIHRVTGIALFAFFFIVGLSGALLGWKKQTGLLPKTQKGQSQNPADWQSIALLTEKANAYLRDSVSSNLSSTLDRLDVRPDKGIVKFTFTDHYWELQLDCTTGELLQIGKRNSDLIEQIHDGSILDRKIFSGKDIFKLFYTSIMGLALIVFVVTGFWLWIGPKRLRRQMHQT